MSGHLVAIVGRPNVGKSTLFNRLAGKRISIVEDQPGVTRDRIYARCSWLNWEFSIVDTGGIDVDPKDTISSQMKKQAEIAIETSDVILFVVDGREGMTMADQDVASLLRKTKKPVILVVNKIERFDDQSQTFEFFNLGFDEVIPVSAAQGLNIGDLLDKVAEHFSVLGEPEYDEDITKVAVIGKTNVGKSSLINSILGEERVIVSDIPGTTRDAIDTPFTIGGKNYVFIDTAGLRRKSRIHEEIERYSIIRGLRAIERCDVVLMVIDATEGVTEQDKKIVGYAHDNGRASIIVVNKWDLVEKDHRTMDKFREKIYQELAFMQYAPIVFVSALTKQRVGRIIELIDYVANQHAFRISTSKFNALLEDAMAMNSPPTDKGRPLKIYYGVQPSIKPPTFLLFINDRELMHFSYERYIENQIRKAFGLEGTPIRIRLKEKEK
jgi:GTP-binding protein